MKPVPLSFVLSLSCQMDWPPVPSPLGSPVWTKEIYRVSFNGAPAKFDIRSWSPDHTKMGKGITLSNEEFQIMVDAFKGDK